MIRNSYLIRDQQIQDLVVLLTLYSYIKKNLSYKINYYNLKIFLNKLIKNINLKIK